MAQVDIDINGRQYKVACDDGQEDRLKQLAAYYDRHVTGLARDIGQIGDARLMLLAALSLCDELFETKKRISELEHGADALEPETVGGASRIIEAAAERLAAMTDKVKRA